MTRHRELELDETVRHANPLIAGAGGRIAGKKWPDVDDRHDRVAHFAPPVGAAFLRCEAFANLHSWATPPEVHQSCHSQGDWGMAITPMLDH
jgi:hypothetical protein